MKKFTLPTALAFVAMISMAFIGHERTADLSEVTQLDVVISYEGCEVSSALYQVMEDGYSKVVDLKQVSSKNPADAHASNLKTVYTTLLAMQIDVSDVEVLEKSQIDECSYVYSVIHRSAN